jgi:hypothetical protein
MQLTEWFPHRIKPVRSGVYEFKSDWLDGYAYWDNDKKLWANGSTCKETAYENRAWLKGAVQTKRWRGIQK